MIKSELKFDECNIEACRDLLRDLRNVVDLYDSWMHVHNNEDDIQQLTGQWPMRTSIDRAHAEYVFTKMFNKIIEKYINSQGKEES